MINENNSSILEELKQLGVLFINSPSIKINDDYYYTQTFNCNENYGVIEFAKKYSTKNIYMMLNQETGLPWFEIINQKYYFYLRAIVI